MKSYTHMKYELYIFIYVYIYIYTYIFLYGIAGDRARVFAFLPFSLFFSTTDDARKSTNDGDGRTDADDGRTTTDPILSYFHFQILYF
jgi:hypothetical protein